MTCGTAAKRPTAVAMRASEIPGATVARLADRVAPMRKKEIMIPQTVPKRPMNGETLPVAARKNIIFSRRDTSALEALSRARLRLSVLAALQPFSAEAFDCE